MPFCCWSGNFRCWFFIIWWRQCCFFFWNSCLFLRSRCLLCINTSIFLKFKGGIWCNAVTFRCYCLSQDVCLSCCKTCYFVGFVCRCPLFYNFSCLLIDELDSCAFQFLSIGNIYLADLNWCDCIFYEKRSALSCAPFNNLVLTPDFLFLYLITLLYMA